MSTRDDEREFTDHTEIGRISWFGYILTVFYTLIGLAIFSFIALIAIGLFSAIFFPLEPYKNYIYSIGFLISFTFLAYSLLYTKSVTLFYDEKGVWLYSGIFYWEQGYSGVKWEDIDGVFFERSFFSWLSRSYKLVIQHKYTKAQELEIREVANGHRVVEKLNDLIHERSGRTPSV